MSGQNVTSAWQSNLLEFRLPPLCARSWDLRSLGTAWPLQMGQIGCPDASVNRHQYTLRNVRTCTVHIANIKPFICPTNAHNTYKIFKQLKSFKIIIVAPTCFGLHKPSSGNPPNMCFAKVAMLISVTYIVIWSYRYSGCICSYCTDKDICNRYQHCHFGEAQVGRLPDDGLYKPKHVGATIIILNDFNCLKIL